MRMSHFWLKGVASYVIPGTGITVYDARDVERPAEQIYKRAVEDAVGEAVRVFNKILFDRDRDADDLRIERIEAGNA